MVIFYFIFIVCQPHHLNEYGFHSIPDAAKTEVPELDGLGFMEDVSGSLGKLLSSSTQEIKCMESIVFSSFNPPPSHRR